MTDPFESYKLYNALKLHFESDSYDAIKYNFKSNVSAKSFFNRKDKFFFAKLAKHHGKELKMYFVSNFINDVNYVGDMINEEGEKNFKRLKKFHESLHYSFEKDINTLDNYMDVNDYNFDTILESKDGQHPIIIKLWLQEEISLETIVILNAILGFIDRESKKITETIIWPGIKRKVTKYEPFINFQTVSCKEIMKNILL
jgi:hypothetical protein